MGTFPKKGESFILSNLISCSVPVKISIHQIKIKTESIQINYRVHNLVDYKSFRYGIVNEDGFTVV